MSNRKDATIYTTVIIDNHGNVYDLGAGDCIPGSDSVWGINAYTCPQSDVASLEKIAAFKQKRRDH